MAEDKLMVQKGGLVPDLIRNRGPNKIDMMSNGAMQLAVVIASSSGSM
jgi:hypothetical protein